MLNRPGELLEAHPYDDVALKNRRHPVEVVAIRCSLCASLDEIGHIETMLTPGFSNSLVALDDRMCAIFANVC
jgi:hypothetical protein